MTRKLAAVQVDTADQKPQKEAGCIIEQAPACPNLLVPSVPAENAPVLAFRASGSPRGMPRLICAGPGMLRSSMRTMRALSTQSHMPHTCKSSACHAPVLRDTDWAAVMVPPTTERSAQVQRSCSIAIGSGAINWLRSHLSSIGPDSPNPRTQRILMHWGQCPQSSSLYSHTDSRYSSPVEC